jgi:hypothetical protein
LSTFLKVPVMLALLLAAAGCGLPDSYFLQPPTPGTLALGSTQPFVFSNPDHSNDFGVSFTGFELYYRFYNVGDTVNSAAYDPTNPADPVTQLTNNGFFPIRSSNDTATSQSIPLINVFVLGLTNAAFSVQVNITGSQTSPGPGTYSLGGNPAVEIRRNVIDPFAGYGFKNFLSNNYPSPSGTPGSNYVPGDADFQKLITTTTPNTAWVALYALSYGLITLSTPTRSTPVYLGYALVSITQP